MKKYLLLTFLISIISCSNTYCNESFEPLVEVEFINLTNSDLTVKASELVSIYPHIEIPVKEFVIAVGQTDLIPISLAPGNERIRKLGLDIIGQGEGYDGSLNLIKLDITKSNTFKVEIYEKGWVYPGDNYWWIDPFICIGTRVID